MCEITGDVASDGCDGCGVCVDDVLRGRVFCWCKLSLAAGVTSSRTELVELSA